MPLNIIRTDLTTYKCDAIVIPTDGRFSGGGSMDYDIHRICGEPLEERLSQFKELRVGDAVCVSGFNSNAKFIIFTRGPIYENDSISAPLLTSTYLNCLKLAFENHCKTLALPLISSGTFGYPKEKAYRIATDCIRHCPQELEMDVALVLYDEESCQIASSIEKNLELPSKRELPFVKNGFSSTSFGLMAFETKTKEQFCNEAMAETLYQSADMAFETLDEGFQKTLFRLIDEKEMSDVEVYKRANLDKRLFSKIRSNENYHPRKETVLAFAVALKLNVSQTKDLLERAGYSLSRSLRMDVIVESFIRQKNYNIDDINVVLFEHDQTLLGAK